MCHLKQNNYKQSYKQNKYKVDILLAILGGGTQHSGYSCLCT